MRRSSTLVAVTLSAALLGASCGADAWSAETSHQIEPGLDGAPDAARAAGGDFDWCIPSGQTVVFDTASSTVLGGPHCDGSTALTFVGGVVDVRHFLIEPGGLLRVIGPNPFVLRAAGTVRIEGTLDVSGTASPGVLTLNTTSVPEAGAAGQAGGGQGGVGSPSTTASSPKGGDGLGAYGLPGAGGGGGETGWSNQSLANVDARRGAGGGGGALGHDQAQQLGPVAVYGPWDQSFLGLDAEGGFPNLDFNANGAVTGPLGPHGGRVGPSPFVDGDPANDFFGKAVDLTSGLRIVGELPVPWAGAGGGAGGDASFVGLGGTYPAVPFSPTGDEKGAGGGGGGGSLEIQAVGDIVFGPTGLILARGGSGGGGENTIFLNRVGGGSGGGSGGHVILQAGGRIDFSQVLAPPAGGGQLAGGILATGGQGGAGRGDLGGASVGSGGKPETDPVLDACPPGHPATGPNACRGHVDGAGGDGGPGIVQLHTRTGFSPSQPSILLPPGLGLGDVCQPLPVGADGSIRLIPDFPGLGDSSAGDSRPDGSSPSASRR